MQTQQPQGQQQQTAYQVSQSVVKRRSLRTLPFTLSPEALQSNHNEYSTHAKSKTNRRRSQAVQVSAAPLLPRKVPAVGHYRWGSSKAADFGVFGWLGGSLVGYIYPRAVQPAELADASRPPTTVKLTFSGITVCTILDF